MQLLPNEQLLLGNDSSPLCLTTLRVRSSGRDWGKVAIQQIFLEDISFVGMTMVSTPLLLLAAAFACGIGIIYLINQNSEAGVAGLILAAVLLLAYFASRRQVLTFASAGGRISLQANKMKYEDIVLCLDAVSARKNDRYLRANTMATLPAQ